jgi:alkylation response protein AidB-like acyl-CoA dehydrogenase
MRFSFDDDQLAMRDAVREMLAKECPPAAVREPSSDAWRALAEMGALSTLVPESAGGMGLDERWLVLVLEEAGYAALPQPIVETAAVAAPILDGGRDPGAVVSTDLGGAVVPWATEADELILRSGDGGLVVVAASDVEIEPADTVDAARRGGLVGSVPTTAVPLAADPAAAFDRGAWATSALLVGLAQRMLDMTVAYVVEREQFGKPVGSFQAVKHHLADAGKELAFARPLVYRAAWSLAVADPERSRDVSTAKAVASDTAEYVGRQALQCHGAIGYTTEADLHLFLKRAWALARSWGDAAWHRDRIGRTLGA